VARVGGVAGMLVGRRVTGAVVGRGMRERVGEVAWINVRHDRVIADVLQVLGGLVHGLVRGAAEVGDVERPLRIRSARGATHGFILAREERLTTKDTKVHEGKARVG